MLVVIFVEIYDGYEMCFFFDGESNEFAMFRVERDGFFF